MDPASLYPIVLDRPSAVYDIREPSPGHSKDTADTTLVNGTGNGHLSVMKAPKLSEEEEDVRDALSRIYDELEISKAWWILE